MKATFNDFITNAPNYKKYDGDATAIYIFENILSRDENIIAMIDTSESGKPALSACITEVENYFLSLNNSFFDLNDDFAKQALGRMVKVILEPFGYLPKSQKDMPKACNSKFVKSAMTYKLTGPASMKVIRTIVEV